jgi:hypothetical protein
MKRYCNKCKYIGVGCSMHICTHPSNVKEKDNYYAPFNEFIKEPSDKNMNNDCPDYLDAEIAKARECLYEAIEKHHNKKWWQFWK